MMQTIVIQGKKIKLQAADLIQSGGEGMVFRWGEKAIKLYHVPTPQHQQKLEAMLKEPGIFRSPAGVYAPNALAKDQTGKTIGFVMPQLPAHFLPTKKLSNPNFCRKHGLKLPQIVRLLLNVHQTLSELHQNNIIVGDLNDHNLFFDPTAASPQSAWIDVDSYQFGRFPCPVALQSFLDPNLYSAVDFSQKPHFSAATDWYAFCVLMMKTLLHVHPYGGAHSQYKSLSARAENGISIFDTNVIYPKQARPLAHLSDPLLAHLERVFAQGERPCFPVSLLRDYANNLRDCSGCQESYPQERASCPACQQKSLFPPPTLQLKDHAQPKLLFETDGLIEYVAADFRDSSGRVQVITRNNDQYTLTRLGVGGIVEEMPLFSGGAGYRFGNFGSHLAVNPPYGSQLLILDLSSGRPQQVSMLESECFLNTAAFATTPTSLYRLANGYLLRGEVRHGNYVEAVIEQVHQHQTKLWGARQNDTMAGIQRYFGDHELFIRTGAGDHLSFSLPLPAGASVQQMDVRFGNSAVILAVHSRHHSRLSQSLFLAQYKNRSLQTLTSLTFETPPILQNNQIFYATDRGVINHQQNALSGSQELTSAADWLHPHPHGVLVQKSHQLFLLPVAAAPHAVSQI